MYWPYIWIHVLSLMLCLVAGVQLWRQYISRMKMSSVYNKHVKTFAKPREWIFRPYDVEHISLNKCPNNKTCYRMSGRIFWSNIVTNSILVLFHLFFVFFWGGHEAYGISAPQPGIKLALFALQNEVLATGLPLKIPIHWFFFIHYPVIILLYPCFPDYPK